MMAGLEVLNDQGFMVAGTSFANLVLYNKYQLTVVGGATPGSGVYWDAYAIPPNDNSVVRFYRAPFPVVEQNGKARCATQWIGQIITCYSFGPVIPNLSPGFGLELYNEEGHQIFNIGRKFLRLKGIHLDPSNYMLDFQVGNNSYPSQNTNLGSGTYAWSTGNSRYFYRRTQFSRRFTDEFEAILAVRVDDAGIYSNLALQFGATKRTRGWVGYGNHVPQTGPITVLVADVAGY